VPGMDTHFTIEQDAMPALDGLPTATEESIFLGEASKGEIGAHIISLEKALELAVKHNRTYQTQKESLYLEALSLTLERHQFTPIFSGSGKVAIVGTARDVQHFSTLAQAAEAAPEVITEIGKLTGTSADLLNAYANVVDKAGNVTGLTDVETKTISEREVQGSSAFGVDLLMKGGGRIAVDLTSNLLRFITGDSRVSTSSALAASITQPLLQGAGSKVATDRLIQAEHDLLYALRTFARYRQQFTVKIASDYYNVLQLRDIVLNNYRSYTSFAKNAERERAFAAEGKRTQAELGRLEQAQLNTENSWVSAIRSYKQALDEFKIELGMSAETSIVLDDQEMAKLKERGIIHPHLENEDAVKVAMTARLDLYTKYDQVDDAERKIDVAANGLKPGLDLVLSTHTPSKSGDRFQKLDFEHTKWNAGVDTDLSLDRKSKRNSYRASLISFERAKRDLESSKDEISLDVRDSWRTLDQAKRSYEIAQKRVEVAKRRVEEQTLLAELGRATALNQVDAENDLNDAENDLTAALVTHTVSRLGFWRDMGILFIKEDGRWEEVKDVQP